MTVKRDALIGILITIMIGAVTIVALCAGAMRAAQLLAVILFVVAAARLLLPARVFPPVRGRLWDCGTLIGLGVAVLYLSQWGDVTPV